MKGSGRNWVGSGRTAQAQPGLTQSQVELSFRQGLHPSAIKIDVLPGHLTAQTIYSPAQLDGKLMQYSPILYCTVRIATSVADL